jgi:hypothetical protein
MSCTYGVDEDIRRDNQALVQQLKEAKAAARNYKAIIEVLPRHSIILSFYHSIILNRRTSTTFRN